jgi:phosphoribosylaminoimidazole-succinocarboxamide synthase
MSEAAALGDLELLSQGKVRDIYAVGDDRLLLSVSDRISTYDVVHPNPVPDKGKVLNGLTAFWFERTEGIVPNHLISYTDVPAELRGRAMLVERLEMVPVECVVRGYITGSGWKDYQATGAVCGIELPDGLEESQQLPEPIFTPATKAEVGDHDENVDFDRAAEIIGDRELLEELRRLTLEVYKAGAEHARERGIILADTKLEFGRRADGTIVLGDEVLTPDSSRSGRPTATRRARASRRSTSSSCATGPPRRAGTSRRRRRRSRRTWSTVRAPATSRPTSGSRMSRFPPGSSEAARLDARAGPDSPQGGNSRPAGPGS